MMNSSVHLFKHFDMIHAGWILNAIYNLESTLENLYTVYNLYFILKSNSTQNKIK